MLQLSDVSNIDSAEVDKNFLKDFIPEIVTAFMQTSGPEDIDIVSKKTEGVRFFALIRIGSRITKKLALIIHDILSHL